MFQVVESNDKGKIVIATRDIRPGEVVFEEEATLSIGKNEHLAPRYMAMQNSSGIQSFLWCLYDAFLRLPQTEKDLVFGLFAPTAIPKCEAMRGYLKESGVPLTDSQIEDIVKLYSVTAHNAFGLEMGAESTVFTGAATKLSSSCNPNCTNNNKGTMLKLLALRNIKSGDELTITYNGDCVREPTHVRRANLLRSKGFLCMCPRCTAPGDDNRQFNCSDAKCRGRMLACQPTSEDVPYLLPCSVCKRSASDAFTAEMFALEKRLPEIRMQLNAGFGRAAQLNLFDATNWRNQMGHLIPKRFPSCHTLSLHVTDAVCAFIDPKTDRGAYMKAIDDILLPYKGMEDMPNAYLCEAYYMVAIKYVHVDMPRAKEYLQKALRTFALISGRENRDDMYDGMMNTIFSLLPAGQQVQKLTECAFCGETPEAVAITLSRCARCQKVAYCGRGCQMAHWEKHHKKTCKKVVSQKK